MCFVKTGFEFFEVVGDVSKSRVLAGDITVSINILGIEKSLRILDLRLGWNGHVRTDAAKSKRNSLINMERVHQNLTPDG